MIKNIIDIKTGEKKESLETGRGRNLDLGRWRRRSGWEEKGLGGERVGHGKGL